MHTDADLPKRPRARARLRRTASSALWAAALLLLQPSGLTQQNPTQRVPGIPAEDEAALRAVVERFYALYAQEDLDGFMGLWSPKSPEFPYRRQTMERTFAAGDFTFTNLVLSRVQVEGERATLRARVEETKVDSRARLTRRQRLVRAVALVREEGAWRLWGYHPAAGDLAAAIGKVIVQQPATGSLNVDGSVFNHPLFGLLLAGDRELVNPELVHLVRMQGHGFQGRGDDPGALAAFQLARTMAEQIGDRAGAAEALINMASVHKRQGNGSQALELYQQSLKLAEEVEDREQIVISLIGIGEIHRLQGKHARALDFYRRSLKPAEELGDKATMAGVLIGTGVLHSSQDDFGRALELYHQGLALARAAGDRRWAAQALGNIGDVHRLDGNYSRALEFYQQGLDLAVELGNKTRIANILKGIGLVEALRGNYARALEFHGRSLKLYEDLGERVGIISSLNNMASIHRVQGDERRALELADRAAGIAARAGMAGPLWRARTLAGHAYMALSQPGPARRAFEEAIANLESVRGDLAGGEQEQRRFLAGRLGPYDGMVELLAAGNNAAEAFGYAERARARVLLDILRGGRVTFASAMTPQERAREQQLNTELVSLNTQLLGERQRRQPDERRLTEIQDRLQKSRLAYEGFRSGLYADHPYLKSRRGERAALTAAQAARWLRTQPAQRASGSMLVLEYVVADKQTWLFTLGGAGPVSAFPIKITREELHRRLAELRSAIRQKEEGKLGSLSQIDRALRRLDLLVKPAAPMVAGTGQVCIVPDSVLWEVPFAALKMPNGQHLIERAAVFCAPSLTALKAMSERRAERRRGVRALWARQLLAMAPFAFAGTANGARTRDPNLRGVFGALPASGNEAAAVSRLFGVKPYLRGKATETRAKQEMVRARFLHFATHGLLDPAQGMYSGVALAPEPGSNVHPSSFILHPSEDGFLEAREVADLRLSADLAVLSACETARGEVARGEGVIGLSWAFFAAGCPSTLVSQWKVNDASTAQLMVTFYRRLMAGSDKAEALRQAQVQLLRSTRHNHPFYWSPFILVGDWR